MHSGEYRSWTGRDDQLTQLRATGAASTPSVEGDSETSPQSLSRQQVDLAVRRTQCKSLALSEESGACAAWAFGSGVRMSDCAAAWAPTHRLLCALGSGSTGAFDLPVAERVRRLRHRMDAAVTFDFQCLSAPFGTCDARRDPKVTTVASEALSNLFARLLCTPVTGGQIS
jgi:hypothetical protein